MDVNIKNLEVNHTYLLRLGTQGMLISITILLITETAYHCRWNNGIESSDTWEHKDSFHNKWVVVEDISKFMELNDRVTSRPIKMTSTKLINCHVCKGFGSVPDTSSTAGNKTCPACNGAKMIPEVITLTQEK